MSKFQPFIPWLATRWLIMSEPPRPEILYWRDLLSDDGYHIAHLEMKRGTYVLLRIKHS